MVTVGVLARFEAKPGNEAAVERFFQEGLPIVQRGKASTAWYAFRLDPATYGVFDIFSDEAGRQAHFLAGAARAEKASNLLENPPIVEEIDVLAAKLPG